MCYNANSIDLVVPDSARPVSRGQRWHTAKIDECLVPLINALNTGGIHTRSCCCGHGRRLGQVVLEDHSEFIILSPDVARRYQGYYGNPKMQIAVLMIATYGLGF